MAQQKIPLTVVHYGRHDPRRKTGGVETFARNLQLVFEGVRFLTPASSRRERDAIRAERLPVICDNQLVLDWPEDLPVIGFQHGVAEIKAKLTGARTDKKLARAQRQAAGRPNTLWVACARWISDTFATLHGNRAHHIVYHQVDVERFDGRLDNAGSRLALHDGRSEHKGKKLFEHLSRAVDGWRFEPLACEPAEVPDRMRRGAAFLHLSRYEGNSIVCNEAMAMDLPCMFTRVGLMRDGAEQLDVHVVDVDAVFGGRDRLVSEVRSFLGTVGERRYHPRAWTLAHATPDKHIRAWRRVMDDYRQLAGG